MRTCVPMCRRARGGHDGARLGDRSIALAPRPLHRRSAIRGQRVGGSGEKGERRLASQLTNFGPHRSMCAQLWDPSSSEFGRNWCQILARHRRMLVEVGQILANFGRTRSDVGQTLASVGRTWPEFCQHWPSSAEFGQTLVNDRPTMVESHQMLAILRQLWPNLLRI